MYKYATVYLCIYIDIIYYYVIWTDSGSMLPEANSRRQEGKYPMIKVLQGCILKLVLHLVNSVSILYRIGNMQSAILLSFVASSSLLACGLQSTNSQMSCYISPYVVYNIYEYLEMIVGVPCLALYTVYLAINLVCLGFKIVRALSKESFQLSG